MDSRVLQLNVHLQDSWTPAPNRAVVGIRSAARSLKAAVRSLCQRMTQRRDADTEASEGEEKIAEAALDAYRQTLQNTFGSSEAVDDVMVKVGRWMNHISY